MLQSQDQTQVSLASGLLSDFMKTTRIPPPHSFLLGCLVGWGIRSGGYVIFKSPQHNTRANKHQTCYCKPESTNCQEGPGPQALETALLVVWPGRAFSSLGSRSQLRFLGPAPIRAPGGGEACAWKAPALSPPKSLLLLQRPTPSRQQVKAASASWRATP